MQRLVQLYAASQQQQPISTSAVANIPSTQYRSTHTSRGGWPYSPSPDLASSQPPASSSSTSSPSTSSSPHVASRTTATTRSISRTVAELLENIRQMKGAKDLWEVAVKRNGMTTSLALLGGVLFADMLLYRPRSQRQAVMQASLATHDQRDDASSTGSSSSGGGGTQQPDSSTGPEHRTVAAHLAAPRVLPAHA